MSKSTNTFGSRHKLLATVSAGALLGMAFAAGSTAAADADRPLLWVELGGQLDRLKDQSDPYIPHFTMFAQQHGLLSIAPLQSSPEYALGEDAAISFQPEDSDWIISASIKYGRSGGKRHKHQEIEVPGVYLSAYKPSFKPEGPNRVGGVPLNRTADYGISTNESHSIIDFQAGRDVGLGLFAHGQSQLLLGVRMARFSRNLNFDLHADPYPHLTSEYIHRFHKSFPVVIHYQFYKAAPQELRDFTGVGPLLSWQGSALLVGSNGENAALDLDWSANIAVLFGRQKMRLRHATTGDSYTNNPLGALAGRPVHVHSHYVNTDVTARSHEVTVPDIGGSVGFSLKFPNAKVSIGYRADFFFNAIDGGIDTRKSDTRGYYGPFASISIGLGD